MVQFEITWIIERSIEILGIFVPGILTLSLVVLYAKLKKSQDKQNEIQKTQTNLMERQEELMEINIRPYIKCELIETNEEVKKRYDGNKSIIMNLINEGDGEAKNIRLRCDLLWNGENIVFHRIAWPQSDENEHIFPRLTRVTKKADLLGGVGDDSLKNGKDELFFTSLEFFETKDNSLENYKNEKRIDGKRIISEKELREIIKKEGKFPIAGQITLIYENAVGKVFVEPLITGTIMETDKHILDEMKENPSGNIVLPEKHIKEDLESITAGIQNY